MLFSAEDLKVDMFFFFFFFSGVFFVICFSGDLFMFIFCLGIFGGFSLSEVPLGDYVHFSRLLGQRCLQVVKRFQ